MFINDWESLFILYILSLEFDLLMIKVCAFIKNKKKTNKQTKKSKKKTKKEKIERKNEMRCLYIVSYSTRHLYHHLMVDY